MEVDVLFPYIGFNQIIFDLFYCWSIDTFYSDFGNWKKKINDLFYFYHNDVKQIKA